MKLRVGLGLVAIAGAFACAAESGAPSGARPGGAPGPGAEPGPGNTGTTPTQTEMIPRPPGQTFGPTLLRRLTNTEYRNTVRDLLGLPAAPADELEREPLSAATRGFENNANALLVTPIISLQYADIAAKLLASYQVPACQGAEADCARAFTASFGRRAYRRPLSDAEVQSYQVLFTSELARSGYSGAITQVIETMLQSPHFLYRFELGDSAQGGSRVLGSHEVATQLSYLLSGTLPDDALMAAADANQLQGAAQIEEQARRLLALPAAQDQLRRFLFQFLGTSRFEEVVKREDVYPEFTPDLSAAMVEEASRFIDSVLWQGNGSLESLYSATHSFVNAPLASLYGLPDPGQGNTLVRAELNPQERMGLLTMPAVLSRHAKAHESEPILRGKFVRVSLLCQVLPSMPQGVVVGPVPDDPSLTTRERFAQHSQDPGCSGCHALIDPIGFGLENYDGIGRYRVTENGKPVDSSGQFSATLDIDGPFQGGPELATKLASSLEAKQCLALQAYRWAFGRDERAAERDVANNIATALAGSGLDVRELMVALAKSDNIIYRTFR